jgi:plasmid stability protein
MEMGDLLIRDVDDNVIRTLKSKAEVNGTSLQQEAKKALTKGAPLTGEERARVFEELRKEFGGFPKVAISGADIVREVREEEG